MDLERLSFDMNDKIVTGKRLRSRIKENFKVDELQELYDICLSHRFRDNNEKIDAINYTLRSKQFLELGGGTNRYAMLKDNYVFKFALDHYGFDDNWTEFNRSAELNPYVTKTYECDGLVATAEYVNLITLEEFRNNKEVIRQILRALSEKYLFADLGTIDKNFCNWGYNDKHELVILDYGYIFQRDDILMRCNKCGSPIGYDSNYDQLICCKCGTKFNVHDVKDMMDGSDKERAEIFKKDDKEIVVEFEPGFDWKKDDPSLAITIKDVRK